MAAGHLDGYRAAVVAFELEVAPADVADAIVAALTGHLGDDAATLRRRTRVLLERISPDLVRERAKQARAATGLRRWVAEPGVDEWHGTFPSEDAATAWAAIDRLAHDLVAAGTCTNIEQARGKALTDLVTGNATIDVQVVLTVPAATGQPRARRGRHRRRRGPVSNPGDRAGPNQRGARGRCRARRPSLDRQRRSLDTRGGAPGGQTADSEVGMVPTTVAPIRPVRDRLTSRRS